MTYNLPFFDAWYDGFGFKIGMEKNNFYSLIDDGSPEGESFVVNPKTTSMHTSIGWFKTLDEITPGFGLKTLSYGMVDADVHYYDYNQNEYRTNITTYDKFELALVYSYENKSKTKYYALFEIDSMSSEYNTADRISVLLGMRY